jgi:hypothetical protein
VDVPKYVNGNTNGNGSGASPHPGLADLDPLHTADLKRSGLSDEMILRMNVGSYDIDLPGVQSALEIPYCTVPGFSRYKLFPPLRDNGTTLKYWQPQGTTPHLYIVPDTLERIADVTQPLYVCEGEKKTARVIQADLTAIGIGGLWCWKAKDSWKGIDELNQTPVADRETYLVPDSDTWFRDDLTQAVYALGRYLEYRGARVSVVLIPQKTTIKIGVDDYLLDHDIEQFHQLKKLPLKHAALSRFKDWYENWKEKKQQQSDDGLQGKPLFMREIEPWETQVNGSDLIIDVCRSIRKYVVAENADIVAMALWCFHAHAIDAFGISPFLNLSSPEKGCGKSTTLTVLSYLLPRPLLSGNVSPASIFRAIDKYKPSFLVDEADTFKKLNEELKGLLNASHLRASAQAIRTVGDSYEPRTFSTWCPKAISLIGRLPDTLNDRSIVIEMKRRKSDEPYERFSYIDPHPDLEVLGRKISRWVKDNFDAIKKCRPKAERIDLRLYDNWLPLLAVADVAGGEWPKWVRIAAEWFRSKVADAPSIKVELLSDMVAVMEGQDRMTSEDIVKALGEMADRPWSDFRHGKPINQVQVAKMLRGFEIKPQNIWIGKPLKGYYTADIIAAHTRYAPSTEPLGPLCEKNNNDIDELAAIFLAAQPAREKASRPADPRGPEGEQPGAGETNGNGRDAQAGDNSPGADNEDVEEAWRRIKAEHAARRSREN